MTEAVVENYETTTRGAASMAAYRAVRILQLLSENTGEDKALLSDELIEHLAHPDDPTRMPISAARRSIYTSISALRHAGYEIDYKRGVGYKLLTRPLTDEEINSYIASGEPFDKAGGYGIQGLAGQFVEKVEGSYSGVIGLPVDETKALLAEIGIRPR